MRGGGYLSWLCMGRWVAGYVCLDIGDASGCVTLDNSDGTLWESVYSGDGIYFGRWVSGCVNFDIGDTME